LWLKLSKQQGTLFLGGGGVRNNTMSTVQALKTVISIHVKLRINL
jgi:hypothetical protein